MKKGGWFKESKRHSLAARGIKTKQDLDLKKYMGKWYNVAGIPQWFDKDCECPKAMYSLIGGKLVKVENTCRKGEGIVGGATPGDQPGSLDVSFGIPFQRGDYNVLWVDDDYETAVVGTKNRKALWVLSRKKSVSRRSLDKALRVAKQQGFPIKKVIRRCK